MSQESGPREHGSRLNSALWGVGVLVGSLAAYSLGDSLAERNDPAQSANAMPAATSSPSVETSASELPSALPSTSPEPTVEASPTSLPSVTELLTPAPSPTASEIIIPTTPPTETLPESHKFNVGSFNIYYSTHKRRWHLSHVMMPERMAKSVYVIEKYLDLVGLQEVREDQWKLIQEKHMLGDDWGIFPTRYATYASQNPIVWKRSEFKFLEGDTIDGPHVTLPGVHPNSTSQVKLLHEATGRTVYLINAHHPVGTDMQSAQARYDNAVWQAKYVKQLQENHPEALIIATADWNSRYDENDIQPTVGNNPQNTAYCLMMNDGGMIDALDAYESREKAELPTKCEPRSVLGVDHAFLSNVNWLEVTNYRYREGELAAPANGSDRHGTIVATLHVEPAEKP